MPAEDRRKKIEAEDAGGFNFQSKTRASLGGTAGGGRKRQERDREVVQGGMAQKRLSLEKY